MLVNILHGFRYRILAVDNGLLSFTDQDHGSWSAVLLTSDHLSCGEEEVWEGLTVWVGDNKRDLTITLPYNWAYMSNLVVGTDIFLCGVTWTEILGSGLPMCS